MVQDSCPGTKFLSHRPDISEATICYLMYRLPLSNRDFEIRAAICPRICLWAVKILFLILSENASVRIRIKSDPYDLWSLVTVSTVSQSVVALYSTPSYYFLSVCLSVYQCLYFIFIFLLPVCLLFYSTVCLLFYSTVCLLFYQSVCFLIVNYFAPMYIIQSSL